MANWTKSELAGKVLEYLQVVAAGQTATAEDSATVQEIIDSVYKHLRKLGLAPFATSAIPEYAQQPLRKIISYEAAPMFGVAVGSLVRPHRRGQKTLREEGEDDLRRYLAGKKQPLKIRGVYY